MKSILKFYIPFLFCTIAVTELISCKKDTIDAEVNLSYQMLSDKTWYLDYSITGTSKRTYVGQSTYFINFLKNKTTLDSDGLKGSYSIEKVGNKLQIHVQAQTSNTNNVEYVYNIELIGSSHLVLDYTLIGAKEPTKLYFTSFR